MSDDEILALTLAWITHADPDELHTLELCAVCAMRALADEALARGAEIAQLAENRDYAFERLNSIARSLGMEGHDHFSPDAILRAATALSKRMSQLETALQLAMPIVEEYVREYGPTPDSDEADIIARVRAALAAGKP